MRDRGWIIDVEEGNSMQVVISTGTPDLYARLDQGVLTLTINRPAARNALTKEMLEALAKQLANAEADDSVKCIVLTGAGAGFCAGGDVKRMAQSDGAPMSAGAVDRSIQRQRRVQQATAGALFKIPKPTIAAINGPAAGAGLSLALACDFRIMSSQAILTTAFAKVGVAGDFGGTYFMTQLVGAAKARQLYFLSERVDAAEAVQLGLANWTCAHAEFEARVDALASSLAAGPVIALRYMKENLNRAMSGSVDDCLDMEATHHIHCYATADHREAARAFVEKRVPVFTGE